MSCRLVHFPNSLVLANALSNECDLNRAVDFVTDASSVTQQASLNNQVFSLCLDDFDGPIDLLLHLVKRSELPIEKLSLAKVADQFLQCIKDTIIFDLELAGEYLVIAANLLSIKAALLLDPKADQQLESEEGPNPHDELLRRLREAEVYQEAARHISSKDLLNIDVFAPAVAKLILKQEATSDQVGLAQHNSALLAKAFTKIIAAIPAPVGIRINWNRISIGDRMQYFVERLKSKPGEKFLFQELLADDLSLPVLVSSFIALLELCKRQVILIRQDSYQDSISLCLVNNGEEYLSNVVKAGSEFDVADVQQDLSQVGNVS